MKIPTLSKYQHGALLMCAIQVSAFQGTTFFSPARAQGTTDALQTIQGVWQNSDRHVVRWESDHTGIFHEASIKIDSETKKVTGMWEAFIAEPNEHGISKRMFVTASGAFGYSMQAFDGKDLHLSWTAPNVGSGYSHSRISDSGNEMHTINGISVSPRGFRPQSELGSKTYTRLADSHKQGWKTIREMLDDGSLIFPDDQEKPFFEPRLERLIGGWTATLPNGKGTVETRWRRTALGSFMVESFAVSGDDGIISNAGINLSGNDPQTGIPTLWSGNSEGFSKTGGWDFIDENIIGQRQGIHRLIRHFRDDKTIDAYWQKNVNGTYERLEGGYTLRKIPGRATAKETVTQFTNNFTDAFNRGDLEKLEDAYHPDAVKAVSRYGMPLAGRKSIVEDFSARTGESGQTLKAEVMTASFITPEHMIAAGKFFLGDADGKEIGSGKWANVFIVREGKCQILQEGAFFSASENKPATGERTELPTPLDPEQRHYRGSEKLAELYTDCWLKKDVDALTNVFRHDGIRSVSTVDSISIDHREIHNAIKEEMEGSIGQTSHEIEAVTLKCQPLGGAYFMAHGRWQAISTDDKLVRGGLWANVFEMRGDEVKLVMESAGAHQP